MGLTDDDMTVISGQKEKLVGVLQTEHGYAKEKAEEKYKSFLGSQKWLLNGALFLIATKIIVWERGS